MNWWIVYQIGLLLARFDSPPDGYSVRDDVFFAQPMAQKRMDLEHPDTLLLDLALFQATNEARRLAGLPAFRYNRFLYQAALNHTESMMRNEYTSHEDLYNLETMTLLKRVQKQTKRFGWLAENIGLYQTIDTPEWYGVRYNKQTRRYEYLASDTKKMYQPFSYASYARYAVQQWLESPHHRANLLNPSFTHVGCAARLSEQPYEQRRAPFGRLVQNFGAELGHTQARR